MNNSVNAWQPSASIEHITIRARVLAQIRKFFNARNVLEVETPLMSAASGTDLHLHPMITHYQESLVAPLQPFYLQTSPEFAMKRLLAAGSGPIYQICKAFRNGEVGRYHNPEFTMLEWYRPGYDHNQLMNEVEQLLKDILQTGDAERISYSTIFKKILNIDPLTVSLETLKACAIKSGLSEVEQWKDESQDTWLQLLFSHLIEPTLGQTVPTFIYDFPASQAALAKVYGAPQVAARFEVYVKGIELANGYHELTDADEQQRRFEQDLIQRRQTHLPTVPISYYLLEAMKSGLPDCAGVALGVDRLILLLTEASHLSEVIAFPVERA
jgi:elongation factor P--(R)-beta-lysine ligase